MTYKTHLKAIRFPEYLLRELDQYVQKGKQSEFIIKATEQALLRLKQAKALKECCGIFAPEDYPEFRSREDIEAWVRNLRQEAEERMAGWPEK